MKYPKKHMKDNFVMWCYLLFYLKCPKIEELNFRSFGCFKSRDFFIVMPHFSYLILKRGKIGHFEYLVHEKWGISNKKHVTWNSQRTENSILRFKGSSNKNANNIIWRNLFGEFPISSRYSKSFRFKTKCRKFSQPGLLKTAAKKTSGHTVFERGYMKFFPSIEEIKL